MTVAQVSEIKPLTLSEQLPVLNDGTGDRDV